MEKQQDFRLKSLLLFYSFSRQNGLRNKIEKIWQKHKIFEKMLFTFLYFGVMIVVRKKTKFIKTEDSK